MRVRIPHRLSSTLLGFTLIEIIVTLTVMSVLSLFGVSAYQTYNRNKSMDLAASQIVTILGLAKARANSQVKPNVPSCTTGRELYAYRVTFCPSGCTTNSNPYRLSVVCGDTGQFTESVGSYTLSGGARFSTTTPQIITFRVLSNDVQGNPGLSIPIQGHGQTRTINISPAGVFSTASGTL